MMSLYCDMDLQPGIDIFIGAEYEGVDRPLGWSSRYGAGKVVNLALGHSGVSVGNAARRARRHLPLPTTSAGAVPATFA